jgi:hypothetical protein
VKRAKLVRSSVTDFVKIAGLVEEDTSGVALEDR